MAYFHGVRVKEIPTSILATVSTTAGMPVVFGTAPVHLTKEPAKYVSKPVICYSWMKRLQHLVILPIGANTLCRRLCTASSSCTQ